jgi:hypothetical protein
MCHFGVGKDGRIDAAFFLQAVQTHFFLCTNALVLLHRFVFVEAHEAEYAAKDVCPCRVVDDNLPWINIDPKESHFFLRAEDTRSYVTTTKTRSGAEIHQEKVVRRYERL